MIVAVALFVALEACRPVPLDTKAASVEWRAPMKVRALHRAGDVVVVQNLWAMSAADVRTGRLLWSYRTKDSAALPEYAVLSGQVVVADDSHVAFLDLHTGEQKKRIALHSFVRSLVGPPLIALTDNRPRLGSTLFALNGDGVVTTRRVVRRVHALSLFGGVAVAQLERNPGEEWSKLYKLTGFDAITLEPLWSIDGTLSTEIQEIGGRPHLIETPWGEHPRPIDLRSGHLGRPLPLREGREQIWGAATWEFETPKSTPGPNGEYATCDRARRNDPDSGKPKWTIDLPFAVVATFLDYERFFMFGSSDEKHHFLVAVDWSTGQIMGAWAGLPDLHTFVRIDERIVGGSFDELFSLRLH